MVEVSTWVYAVNAKSEIMLVVAATTQVRFLMRQLTSLWRPRYVCLRVRAQVRARRASKGRGRALWDNLMRRVAIRREYAQQYSSAALVSSRPKITGQPRTPYTVPLDRKLSAHDIVLFRKYAEASVAGVASPSSDDSPGRKFRTNIFSKVVRFVIKPTRSADKDLAALAGQMRTSGEHDAWSDWKLLVRATMPALDVHITAAAKSGQDNFSVNLRTRRWCMGVDYVPMSATKLCSVSSAAAAHTDWVLRVSGEEFIAVDDARRCQHCTKPAVVCRYVGPNNSTTHALTMSVHTHVWGNRDADIHARHLFPETWSLPRSFAVNVRPAPALNTHAGDHWPQLLGSADAVLSSGCCRCLQWPTAPGPGRLILYTYAGLGNLMRMARRMLQPLSHRHVIAGKWSARQRDRVAPLARYGGVEGLTGTAGTPKLVLQAAVPEVLVHARVLDAVVSADPYPLMICAK